MKGLEKQQKDSGALAGTPEYDWYEQKKAARQNQIFKTVGVEVPPVTAIDIPYPKPEEKPGFFDRIFGSGKPSAPAQNKVIPFSQLPAKG